MYGAHNVPARVLVDTASVTPVRDTINMATIIHVATVCRPDAKTGIQANPIINCAAISTTPVHCTAGETVVLGDVICSHNAMDAKMYNIGHTTENTMPGGEDAGLGSSVFLGTRSADDAAQTCTNTIMTTRIPMDGADAFGNVLADIKAVGKGMNYQRSTEIGGLHDVPSGRGHHFQTRIQVRRLTLP